MTECFMAGVTEENREERYQQLYAGVRQNIDTLGFQVMGVGPGENRPGFSYTIGLVERGWPEMICFALPPTFAHAMFTTAAERWAEHGVPEDGDVDLEIANLPAAWRDLPAGPAFGDFLIQQRMYYESWHARHIDLTDRAMQLVWSDKNGVLPWQPGVERPCVELQSQIIDLGLKN